MYASNLLSNPSHGGQCRRQCCDGAIFFLPAREGGRSALCSGRLRVRDGTESIHVNVVQSGADMVVATCAKTSGSAKICRSDRFLMRI
eukprot:m.800285 g.800285  ORF g.800285 m.800285 type:complete len:88 (-) comp23355_c0_seq2:2416-2679(-)